MSLPEHSISEITPEQAAEFRQFCQVSSQLSYVRPEFGMTPDMFSEEVFERPDVVEWYDEMCSATNQNKAWVARDEVQSVIGTIGAEHRQDYVELHSFYTALQGQGLGRELFGYVEEFADGLPIRLDVIQYMDRTIDMYKRWGFVIDETCGKPWFLLGRDWHAEAREAYQGIYMVRQ